MLFSRCCPANPTFHFYNSSFSIRLIPPGNRTLQVASTLSLRKHLIWLRQTRFVFYLFEHIVYGLLYKNRCSKANHYLDCMLRVLRSVSRVVWMKKAMKLLCKFSFHSSTILISTCWVLHDFLYAAKKGEKKLFYIRNQKVFGKTFRKSLRRYLKQTLVENLKYSVYVFYLFI